MGKSPEFAGTPSLVYPFAFTLRISYLIIFSPQSRKERRVDFYFHFLLRGQKVKNNCFSGNLIAFGICAI
jgi:hypothetical protein